MILSNALWSVNGTTLGSGQLADENPCQILSHVYLRLGGVAGGRHSARNFPLNDLMNALSVGLPGRLLARQ